MGEATDTLRGDDAAQDMERDPDTEEIKAQIEQTRTEMSETIDAIQAKLSPDALKEQAVDSVKDMTEAAKEAAKAAVTEAVGQTKQAIHDATIGKVETMMSTTRETARNKSNGILDTIRQNPVPAALAAIGIGWLVMKGRSSSDDYEWSDQRAYDYRGRRYQRQGAYPYPAEYRPAGYPNGYMEDDGQNIVVEAAGQAKDKASDLASSAKHAVSHAASGAADAVESVASGAAGAVGSVTSTAKDTVGSVAGGVADTAGNVVGGTRDRADDLSHYAMRRASRARGGVEQMLQDNPLAVGAIAAALGTAIGLAAPGTDKERELLGPMRDSLMEKAQPMVQEKLEQVQNVAKEAASSIKEEAQIAADNVKVATQMEAEKQGLTQSPGQSQNQGGQNQSQNQGQNRPQGQGMNPTGNQGQNRPQNQGQSSNPGKSSF